ncbi:MAG: hypothetical protein IJS15_15720 [Victivallales bacterium]|nr:hypothetical protein [Victivallales bacterium]
MSLIDWLILIIPTAFVMYMGFYSRRYVRDVSDYLAAGRVAGRYVLSLGDVANALSIITLVAYVESHYKTGFSVGFWSSVLAPLSIVLSLTGFCAYRFRETKAMSLGQFLEMRYSRRFRIFAAALRSLAEMIANMIMPAVASRFFIQMLGLPDNINVFGLQIPTFVILVILFLTMAITLICLGGTLSLLVTDTIQGMFLYPLLAIFVIFIIYKFSWSKEILPVMMDRAPGESYINPYDIKKLRDFNVFSMVIVAAYNSIMQRASWIGAGYTTAAKSPQEQKMAGLLGGWRGALVSMFYLLIAICLITFLNHKDFANEAHQVRTTLATRVADDVIKDTQTRTAVKETIAQIKPIVHEIGVDKPLGQNDNLDSAFLAHIHESLKADAKSRAPEDEKSQIDAEGKANDTFQQCRTLYHQLTLSVTMRHLLPKGMFGMFCLLLFLAMLSTDDTRIYSAALTIAQDVVLPLKKEPFTPKGHVMMIRIVSIGIGVFFFFGAFLMAQKDYINMFVSLACAMWTAGCGPVMIFGLYSKFGTTAGAWASQITGMSCSLIYIFVQRNWANIVYPSIAKMHMVDFCDKTLRMLSAPYGTWIEWKMDAVKCPVNSYEFLFFLSLASLIIYVVVSKLTCKQPFNMDRMLHRGKYSLGEERNLKREWNLKSIFKNIIGITPEYSKGDRLIAYGIFTHSFIYSFVFCFLGSVLWNTFSRWPIQYWGRYFFIVHLCVPGAIAAISTCWFGIGGTIDLFRLFKALKERVANPLDDGRVEGEMSLADKAALEKVDAEKADIEKKDN